MCGYASGAAQAIYEAGRGSELRGFLLFAPGAKQWNKEKAHSSATFCSKQSQGINEPRVSWFKPKTAFGLEAIAEFSRVLSAKGRPNKAMVYRRMAKVRRKGTSWP